MDKFIPVNEPNIEKSDIQSVLKVLKSGWISAEGNNVKLFEEKFSKFIGHKYGITVSNGTAALEVAIQSLNLPKDSEVIIPNFTIFSNAIACLKNNLKIKPIDCNKFDWNMNIELILKNITAKTKLIIATHIYNYPIQIEKLVKICKQKKIILMEDAAENFGQVNKDKKYGSFGDISTYSFYANKQITTGEGGMITTNSKNLYKKACNLRNLSFGKIDRFNHDDISSNYRMSNIQATLGLSQLKRIDNIVKKRHLIGRQYHKYLSSNKNIFIPNPTNNNLKNIYWVIGILILNTKLNMNAKYVMKKLKEKNIGTRPFFWPMHRQKMLKKMSFYNSKKFPNSDYISKYGFYLPSSLNLTKNKIKYISECVNEIISK
ncbi:DegT/DnrJ/EryC1/StrS family aminotransferase [Candidatus Pelagibacter sp. HIMB1746]|uniref:DegT/DnrJ/EryC1/StrS family aminotransferase n=1 Tax=Candidatus Pelagibacter sp. HIMB1746 TaxID=3413370 RepID=UPI003F83E4A1